MAPRRPPRPTPPDVDVLRAALGQGKIVRVGIAPSDQFPEGVTGRVRRIGDPAIDGDEFLFVEVPIGGGKDVLPFAPSDLTNSPARKPALAAAPSPRAVRPKAATAPTTGPVSHSPSNTTVPGQTLIPALAAQDSPPAVAPTAVVEQPAMRGKTATSRPAGGAGRGKRAPVTITISTAGDESASWRIEAKIGVKAAVRPTMIPPSRVWEIVQSLGEPKLTDLVQTLLDDHRRSTQARADALAAELSALQAELNSFPHKGG